jgi:hypothetical protein
MKTINVKAPYSYPEAISIQWVDENGDLLECDHAGAEIEYLDYAKSSFWADAGIYVNDDSETLPTLVCKCGFEEIQEPDEPDYEREDY